MSILNNSLLLGAPAGATGYSIPRSVRLNSADSAFFSRTPASAGNRKTWTWAGWVKRSGLGTIQTLFGVDNGTGNDFFVIGLQSDDTLYTSNYASYFKQTSQVLRDCSAWYHVVCAVDTTNATAADRVRIYINGSRVTAFASSSDPSLNTDLGINQAVAHKIGDVGALARRFSGLLADLHFCDGTAYDASAFGEFDLNGIWQPKKFAGVYGSQGWHLDFADNSAATAATLGKDSAGSNNWTPNNLSVQGGNGNYSANLYTGSTTTYNGSATDTDFYNGGISTRIKGFDGNLGTVVYSANVGGGWLYFRPSIALSSVTQLRVYASYVEEIRINGNVATVSPSVPATSTQWYSITNPPSTITEIAVKGHVAQGAAARFSAIEINGVILVDYAAGSGNDSLVDSPTNGTASSGGDAGGVVVGNYATLNPLHQYAATLSNGNLDCSIASGWVGSTVHMSTGKWYAEFTLGSSSAIQMFGVCTSVQSGSGYPWQASTPNVTYYAADGRIYVDGVNTGTSGSASATAGDIISLAFDVDAKSVAIRKNNTLLVTKTIGTAASYMFYISDGGGTITATFNAGQRPFAYAAPSGFKSLNTANLPTPTILKGSDYFDTKLYTGNGSTQTISGLGFSPDLVWVKQRNGVEWHALFNTISGPTYRLHSNATTEESVRVNSLTAFTSTGFTCGDHNEINGNANPYAAWCWDAGSSNSTNTAGSITSTVRANASAGFSIVTYTGNGATNATVGHGLGVTPAMVIAKNRNTTNGWAVWFTGFSANEYLVLNSTGAKATFSTQWGSTPTSTVFGVADGSVNGSGNNIVAYCFAPVAGYSSAFSYSGNGSADGPAVHLGFRPRLILIKRTDFISNWTIRDTARDTYNKSTLDLYANSSAAEVSAGPDIDILSSGFKCRDAGGSATNASGGTYIGFAWAENPFSIARAR